MANHYRITTNGKRYRVEVWAPVQGVAYWRPYGDASGLYLDREGAEEFIKFLRDMEGEWLPVADAEVVQS